MFFASDNTGPAHPEVMDALARANEGYAMPYGADPIMEEVRSKLRDVFEAPEAAVYLVATGTAANVLALSCLTNPYDSIFCSTVAHIDDDECNAPEFYSGGAKLTTVEPAIDKMAPEALEEAILRRGNAVHNAQRGAVSITQVAERGGVYSLEELAALTKVAKRYDLPVHLDGARFANAQVALGCSAAEMSWKLGVDAVSFGGTKNGLMAVEAVILFDPKKAWEFELRRKRGAHLFSKHRYLSAQMQAYLKDDLWLRSAAQANANMARLANGLREVPGTRFMQEPEANLVYAHLPRAAHQRLKAAGAIYYLMDGPLENGDPEEPLLCRLVADWSISEAQIDQFIKLARG